LVFSKTQFIVCFWSSQIGHWVCGKKLNFLALRVIQLFTNPKKNWLWEKPSSISPKTKKHSGCCEEVKLSLAPRVASPSTKIQYQIGNEGKQKCVKDRKILKIDFL
jgi:hypothetical protein